MKHPIKQCIVDGETFIYDPERSTGRYIREWGVCICDGCYSDDGVVASPDFLDRLAAKKIVPQFTETGTVLIPD